MLEIAGDGGEVNHKDVVVQEDEEAYDLEASCAEDDAVDNIVDNEEEHVKVQANAKLLVVAACFNVCTGCNQTGPHA